LLEGRRATTHWAFRDVLASAGVDVVIERYVVDGKFVTGGGVTAGIDMALALTARQFGEKTAKVIQLGLEYDPAPPFAGGTPETSEPAIVEAAMQALSAAAGAGVPAND
jgi:cyclohexyl-isocyanide hydratase